MPKKKARPEWGKAPSGIGREAEVFAGEVLTKLAERIGASDAEKRRELGTALNNATTMYLGIRQLDDAPKPAAMRAALEAMRDEAFGLLNKIDTLDHWSGLILWEAYKRAGRQFDDEFPGLEPSRMHDTDRRHVRRLRDVLSRAVELVDGTPGRPDLDTLRYLATSIASIYVAHAKKPFRFDTHRDESKGGTLVVLTPSAQWVSDAIALADPSVSQANIRTVLKFVQQQRRKDERIRAKQPAATT